MGFAKKFEIFPSFYLRQNKPENTSNDILQRKNAFLAYETKNLIKTKN